MSKLIVAISLLSLICKNGRAEMRNQVCNITQNMLPEGDYLDHWFMSQEKLEEMWPQLTSKCQLLERKLYNFKTTYELMVELFLFCFNSSFCAYYTCKFKFGRTEMIE